MTTFTEAQARRLLVGSVAAAATFALVVGGPALKFEFDCRADGGTLTRHNGVVTCATADYIRSDVR